MNLVGSIFAITFVRNKFINFMSYLVSDRSSVRQSRLEEVANRIPRAIQSKILRLNDHKGILEVLWLSTPTNIWKEIVLDIWKDAGEIEINHYVITPIN